MFTATIAEQTFGTVQCLYVLIVLYMDIDSREVALYWDFICSQYEVRNGGHCESDRCDSFYPKTTILIAKLAFIRMFMASMALMNLHNLFIFTVNKSC